MARQVALVCSDCNRRLGGQETFARHRYIAGDRYRCRSDADLARKGFSRDRWLVWHRGPNPDQTSLLAPTETDRNNIFKNNVIVPDPRTLARVTDPETSQTAAWRLSGKAGTMRRVLLECYTHDGGMTAEEAAIRAGFTAEDGAWKRVSDLLNAGLLEDTGETRPGRSGRQQRVLRITTTGSRVA